MPHENPGNVRNALSYTPCGKYIVYPLGSFVVIKNVRTGKESFFDGHTKEVSCIAISKDGSRLVSGQINIPGVKVSKRGQLRLCTQIVQT
jgi:WD40 repeat protein